MSNSPTFTNSDVEEILRVVDNLTDVEVKLETAEFKLHVRKGVTAAITVSEPAVSMPPPTSAVPAATVGKNAFTSIWISEIWSAEIVPASRCSSVDSIIRCK